jgi:predicted DNA-binding protein (UPF0251 family)
MARPCCIRHVGGHSSTPLFKPAGIPAVLLEETVLTLDELEALRLADLEGLHQEVAAARMGISRPTFGRIVDSARRKVAEALTVGKALRIEGGPVCPSSRPRGRCPACVARPTAPHVIRREPGAKEPP